MQETQARFTTQNSSFTWKIDDDGFLRCKTTVLKSTVMDYAPDQIGTDGVPNSLKDRQTIALFVPKEELGSTDSIDSLEGKPVSIDHVWQSQGNVEAVGNIAGKPFFDLETGLLYADILVTDPDAIERITSSDLTTKLVEQSAGYRNGIEWTPGVTEDGQVYDGIQRNIKYNHIALLPKGQGRAGGDVRILNKDGRASNVSEYTLVRITNSEHSVRIFNEDVPKFDGAMKKKDDEIDNAMDPKDVEEHLQTIERLNNEIAEGATANEKLVSERDEVAGKVETLKNQLEAALDPKAKQESVNAALAEQESANKIINSFAGKIDEKQKSEIKSNLKSLFGKDLHGFVVNKALSLNKKDELTPAELENADMVKGRFLALADTADIVAKTTVSGAGVMTALNKADESRLDTTAKRMVDKWAEYNAKPNSK